MKGQFQVKMAKMDFRVQRAGNQNLSLCFRQMALWQEYILLVRLEHMDQLMMQREDRVSTEYGEQVSHKIREV